MNQLMNNPTFEVFMQQIGHYRSLFNEGLKKEANRYLSKLADDFKLLPKDRQEELLYKLCLDICDGDDSYRMKERGNGRPPYILDKLVWEYLNEQCSLQKMPQLRWSYELYHYNPFDKAFNPFEALLKAFQHEERDEKTIELYFGSLLSLLNWGAHHFPEGCIIERSSYEDTVKKCHAAMEQVKVKEKQLSALNYYERLYDCYYKYTDSDRTLDFYELCEAAGIEFQSSPTYCFR